MWVDGQRIATQKLDNNQPGEFFEREYALPAALTYGKQQIVVKFVPHPGNIAGGLYGCATLKANGS